VRICLLASGSRGNAVYIENGSARLLVDAGLSAREISARLAGIGVEPDTLDAILVTHEHRDHCQGLGPMSRRYTLPTYLHPATLEALGDVGKLPEVREFETGSPFQLRDVEIEAFPLTHDAAHTVGFTITGSEGKIGFATDVGMVTRLLRQRLGSCRVLVLESNHDEQMLMTGPYPWPLKQRVRGSHGHLSNPEAAELLGDLLWEGLEGVFLAHLSETNNQPQLALKHARDTFARQTVCDPVLHVGSQDLASICLHL